jgi:PhnB protein
MVRISPHLNFAGQCRAAFARYQAVLGGDIQVMLSYGDSPMAANFDARWHGLILHATLAIGDMEIMGTDQPPDRYQAPQGICVAVTLPTAEKARAVFEGLAEGGRITLAFQSTFWTQGFGMLVDAFGIPWEINCSQAPA